ncbi:protein of unknown function [Trichlorobacter ammonificans]|uniref:Uncharacterized protein n=1 Tax=Trichlorobacter ammonificans TaxID=2916410 RepID=A0ABM9D6E1_9BACT|nr:protein of unknown function [Trichlorobacter ammonificans]
MARNSKTDKFQSTPALWDGRFSAKAATEKVSSLFQSTPALWDGRFAEVARSSRS